MAASIFVSLGDFVRAARSPTVNRDDALAELESGRARVRLTLPGMSDLQVQTWIPPVEVTELLTDEEPLVRDLLPDRARQTGPELFSNELAERLLEDWVRVGRELGSVLLPQRAADALRSFGGSAVDLRLEIPDHGLNAVPWELARLADTGRLLALDPNVATMSRAMSKEAVARDEVRFVQVALNRLLGAGLDLDDDFGPKTDGALRQYQERHGLVADGVVRHDVLTHMQADLARQPDRSGPPLVILAQPSTSRQFEGHRGKASMGIDLQWVYQSNGYIVWEVENPTLDKLVGAVGKAVDSGRVPSVLHLSGGLRESGGGVAFTFLAGEWWHEALSGSRYSDEIPVTALDRLLAQFPRDSFRPLVILDVDRPSAAIDTVAYLLLRNSYAGDLFALGKCPAVLAIGLASDVADPFGSYGELVHLLAAETSIGETCAQVRRQARPFQMQDLERALPLAGIALFTHLPWLRIARG
jgi:peptidoglycan hydrolase-like protein with peptidoglycan-binding domain